MYYIRLRKLIVQILDVHNDYATGIWQLYSHAKSINFDMYSFNSKPNNQLLNKVSLLTNIGTIDGYCHE